ncbi:MAG: alpha/beta hydrolase [Deltaproteobacteria bacterium]|nr:alpha/beta hydrolase [Deltaproteobacteria bacterium]MBI3387671.1 alpha/beta hydrolase [Deltaproteobacteria bacterium]
MRVTHGRVTLELHEVTQRDGPALLLLHALYESSASWGEAPAAWPGRVYALDFSGHGRSDWLVGGGYYPEMLVADADAALAHIGGAALAGAGIGAYVATLLAGSRSALVPAALLLPGAGLAGGGAQPDFNQPRQPLSPPPHQGCDPMVHVLDRDARPPDYVEPFARAAKRLLLIEDGAARPPWWEAARGVTRAEVAPAELSVALARLAAA